MPMRAIWETAFSAGHGDIDTQHQQLLAQSTALADTLAAGDSEAGHQAFDQAFVQFKGLVRAHFEAEAALLARLGYADLEDHRMECDEFEYLAGEIATAENFSRLELQRFVAVWTLGHVKGSALQVRDLLASGTAPDPA